MEYGTGPAQHPILFLVDHPHVMEDTTSSTNAAATTAEVTFSDHVETTLTNVFESQTELDSASFDAISYINQNFPNERSLQRVNQFLHMTTQKLETLDQEIYQSVLEQATSGKQADEDVAAVKTAIRDLFQKIKDIKEKAEESEVMVQEISRDIKKLDYAKRHLTTTITGLKRLHMLVTAVDQLEFMAQRREYRDAANLLNAVNQLSKHFEQYNGVPKVDELRKAVSDTRRALKAQVLQDFRDIQLPAESDVSGDAPDYDRDQLHNACLVVDALGKEVRSRITERFCCDQLSEYDGIFRSGGGEDTLEAVERRYALWRRMLRRYEKTFANVFPGYWEVDMELCVDFARRTRRHIEKILQSIIPPESADVGVLLKALKTTLKFERESEKMFHSFDNEKEEDSGGKSSDLQERRRTVRASSSDGGGGGEFSDDEEDEEEEGEALYDDEGNEVDPDSATGIRLKYKRRQEMERRKQEFKERGVSGGDTKDGGDTNVSNRRRRGSRAKSTGANEEEEEEEEVTPKVSFLGLISSCFGNYMAAYVQLERDNMNTKLRDFDVQEVDEDMKKFSTSYNMFGYMHNSIKRCCDLNTGQAFYDLHLEYKAVLNEFATILSNQLVRPSGTKNSFGETVYKFGDGDDIPRLACYIVNTAEYCLDNMPKLQENIQSRIDDEYKERIDLEEDEDSFYEVINAAIKVLAGGLQNRVTPKLEVMAKTNWVTHSDVGDQSMYVRDICVVCEEIVILCKDIMSETYFRSFCDSFATTCLPQFVQSIHRCKRIGEMGAQQLLLDTHGVKTLFLGLREMGDDSAPVSQRRDAYLKRVDEEMKKAESLLKLVSYPADRLAQTFPVLWPEGTQEDLRALMALKGMKSNEQSEVLQQSTFSGGVSSSGTSYNSSSSSSSSSNPLQEKKKAFFTQGFKALDTMKSTFGRR